MQSCGFLGLPVICVFSMVTKIVLVVKCTAETGF
jgi:hypothetical protein